MMPPACASRSCGLAVAAALLCLAPILAGAAGPAPDPPTQSADLAITNLAVSPTPGVMVNAKATYTISFVNNGPEAAGNAFVKLPTPAHTSFESAAVLGGAGWSLTTAPAVGASGDVIFTNGSGPASAATAQFQVVVSVNPGTAHYTTITATASTYTTDANTIDPVSANNAATATTKAILVADPAEPNETPATAYVLAMGTTSGLVFSVGDTTDSDWYKFTVAPADAGKDLAVNVRITSTYPVPQPSGWRSDIDFSLLNSSLNLDAVALSAVDNETLFLHNVAAGDHYINIEYSTTSYAEGEGWARYEITIATGTAADFGIGYISGRVVDGGGNGVAHVVVETPTYNNYWNVSFVSAATDALGYFTIASPPGDHYVFFTGNQEVANNPEVNIVDEWYLDKPTQAQAGHVTVSTGGSIDLGVITVAEGAIVTGQVTNMSAAPLENVYVRAYSSSDNWYSGYAYTDSSGHYTLKHVPVPGAKIRFSRSGYGLEWYDDQPSFATGTTLATSPGVTLSGINAQLAAGGLISGTVKDPSGDGVALNLVLYSTTDASFARATLVSTAGTGAFQFTQLKAGTYKLYADTAGTSFVPEWYDGGASFGTATSISVSTGTNTTGINIVLASGAGGDFSGDGRSDILWRHATQGDIWLWEMEGATNGWAAYGGTVDPAWRIVSVADQTGDGWPDVLWRNTATGEIYLWEVAGGGVQQQTYMGTVPVDYEIEGTGDFDGDGKADILWRGTAGDLWLWLVDGAAVKAELSAGTVDPSYVVRGVADLSGDRKMDILWQGAAGDLWLWVMSGATPQVEAYVGTVTDARYEIQPLADFDGNGQADILWWNHQQGDLWLWAMGSATTHTEAYVGTVADTNYRIVGTGDYNGDGKADLLWRHVVQGDLWLWLMNGAAKLSENYVGTAPVEYQIIK